MNPYHQPAQPIEYATTRELDALRAHLQRLESQVRTLTIQHQVRQAAAKGATALSIPLRLATLGISIAIGAIVIGEIFWNVFIAR